MSATTAGRSMPDTYFALVKRFPLTRIRDRDHFAEARTVLDGLLRQSLDAGGEAYLDVLTDLVERYEAAHVPIPDAPVSDVLRELIDANDLSQQKLAEATGIAQSTISAILSGKRAPTPAQMTALGRHFGLPAAVFLPR